MSGLRQPSEAEQNILITAHEAQRNLREALRLRPGQKLIQRFIVSADCWGNETDHFSSIFGVPVILDTTLPSKTVLYALAADEAVKM